MSTFEVRNDLNKDRSILVLEWFKYYRTHALKMYTGHDYPLERAQEPLIRDVRPWWLSFGQLSLQREHHIMIRNPKSSPFYAPTSYWYQVERTTSIECYIYLFQATIKCNVSQFNLLLIIGNHPSASLKKKTHKEFYCINRRSLKALVQLLC